MYKLLIVDDNNLQIQNLFYFVNWKELGIGEMRTAQDGKTGIQVYEEFQPNIIITDVVMPIMNGIDMVKEIRKIDKKTKIIFISCYDDFKYASEAMKNEAVDYILKPIDTDELKSCINICIDKIKAEEKTDNMNELIEKNLDVLRENFLYRVSYTKHIDINYVKSAYLDLMFDRYNFFAIAKFQITQINGSIISICDIINEMKQNLFIDVDGVVIVENEKELVVMFMGLYDDESTYFNYIIKNTKMFCKYMCKEHGINYDVGLSSTHTSIFDVYLMKTQASCAIESKLIFSEEGIYLYDDHEYLVPDYNFMDIKNGLNNLLVDYDEKKIESFLDSYCLKNVIYNKNDIKSLYVTMVAALQLFLLDRGLDIKEIFESNETIWRKVDSFDTIDAIRQWLYNIIRAIIEYANDDEKNSHEKLISNIVEYINENYSTISNIEDIAKKLYISSSYARSIFKKYVGITIFDYLVNVRMEAAKTLLADQNSKVYEVTELVGYKSKPHFVTVFKRYTGMMPKEYQQSLVMGEGMANAEQKHF